MKALRFDRTGDLDALRLAEVAEPAASAGEVRVRIVAGGLNPSDVKNVLGRFPYTTVPRTPGRDLAGVIDQGSPERLGQEVWATGNELGFTRDGSHAELVTLPADGVVLKPRSLSFAQAASCGVPYTTALDALERAGAGPGVRVVVIGLGAVGRAALDLARWLGADVAGATRHAGQLEELRARGFRAIALVAPDLAVRPDAEADALHGAVSEHFASGADVLFDTTGAWLAAAPAALAPAGRIAVIAAPPDGHVRVPVLALYRKGGVIIGINSLLHDTRGCTPMLARLAAAFDAGHLPPPAAPDEVPLAAGVHAYARVNAGRSHKIVFTMERGAP